jgi:hypothetical protein
LPTACALPLNVGTFGVSRWQLSNNLLHTIGSGMSQSWVVEQSGFFGGISDLVNALQCDGGSCCC